VPLTERELFFVKMLERAGELGLIHGRRSGDTATKKGTRSMNTNRSDFMMPHCSSTLRDAGAVKRVRSLDVPTDPCYMNSV